MRLTNKITCCLHLAVAIKALMTSEDGLLMWCLKAYQRFHNKIAPHVTLWRRCQAAPPVILWAFVLSVVSTSRICYIEIFVIKTVATDAAVQVTLDLKADLANPIRNDTKTKYSHTHTQKKNKRTCVSGDAIHI